MKYYITTPLYYVNAAPHIGHTYTTIAAETIARFKAMQGYEAVLFTGTDEHGQKVERSAQAAGKTPEDFTRIVAEEFQKQWESLGLRIDRTIRTTDPRHHKTVQWLFEQCLKNGYVYKGSYTGQYCVYDELYVNDAKPGDPCPECGRPTETVTEENYFFKLSAFTDRLLKLYEDDPGFVQPESRRNEVLSFIRQGLQDLSISRTTIKWGIPLPVEGNHVFYVWFDALIGYMSGVKDDPGMWPADLHLIGKEILRFHAVFWPAFLMAAGQPLPKKIFAHGWLLFENDKMSKSRGNMLRAEPIRRVVGVDGLRYFLLREIVFGQDGSFSYDALIGRYNSELANGLGNLASRTLTMIHQYRGGAIPASAGDEGIATVALTTIRNAVTLFDEFEFSRGLEAIWGMLSAVDRYIVQQTPWKLAKNPDAREALDKTLYTSAEALRIATALLAPVLPDSAGKIWSQLGMPEPVESVRLDALTWGQLQGGQKIGEIAAVFPRIELKDAVARMQGFEAEVSAHQAALLGKTAPAAGESPAPSDGKQGSSDSKIAIDDFSKVDLRVGLVLSAEPVKGADKLLHLKVDIGEPEPRTIVAGIAEAYHPGQMVGRKVVIVANLQPRKLRGLTSNGMIVAASLEGGKPVLAGFLEDVPVGARLK
ncbi:MAG TPA: methionine--tRNA ligase [Bryobacteraceae bacterium]|jgi:methionyl-tRNA synthetase|nr:methionine--tRNA ligase [Bryobacteraceae bacterium]